MYDDQISRNVAALCRPTREARISAAEERMAKTRANMERQRESDKHAYKLLCLRFAMRRHLYTEDSIRRVEASLNTRRTLLNIGERTDQAISKLQNILDSKVPKKVAEDGSL